MSISYAEAQKRALWLFEIDIGGSIYRFATENVTVTDDDGNSFRYEEGLTEPTVSLVSDGGVSTSTSITLSSTVDWALIEAQGHSIEYAPCVLRRWWDGLKLERARVYLRGLALGVGYGESGEELTFSLTRDPGLQSDLMVDSMARVTGTTWPVNEGMRSGFVVDPKAYTAMYNLVIGCPGHDPTASEPKDAVPLLMVEWKTSGGDSRVVVMLGRAHATTVRLHNTRVGTSIDAATFGQQRDLLGREVSYAECPFPEVNTANHVNDEYWCGFQDDATYGGGVPNPFEPDTPLRGAGDVILWLLLTKTSIKVDRGRMHTVRDWLNQFKIDTYINTEINAWNWLEAAVLRWIPVIPMESDQGIYFMPIRWDFTSIDAVAHLSVARQECSRLGNIERLGQPVYNEIVVNYRPARGGPKKWYSQKVLTAKSGQLGTVFQNTIDDRILGSYLARHSQAAPWGIRPFTVDIPQTWDSDTAGLVAQLLMQRYAWPKRTVRYQADKEFEILEPGTAITITDADVHLANAVAYIVDITLDGESPVLDLILLDHPVHSQRATT